MALTDKLSNIAEAIRTKTETTGKMTLTEMPDKILGIQTSEDLDAELTEQQQLISELKTTLEGKAAGVTINNQDKTITENGTYTADEGYTGLGTVTVDVQASGGETGEKSTFAKYIGGTLDEVAESDLNGVTEIDEYAFYGSSIQKCNIPNSITKIGYYAFQKSAISTISLPASITNIGYEVFRDCLSLTYADMGEVSGVGVPQDTFNGCTKLETVVLPNDTVAIGRYAFRACTNLKSINFPSTLSIISHSAFNNTGLTEIVLPSSITKLDTQAFYYSKSLAKVSVLATTPPTLGSNVFGSTALAQIIVPVGCAEAYKSATNWSAFADIIVEEGA
jgi:hypothetical protein